MSGKATNGSRQRRGMAAEDLAAAHLRSRGMKIEARNVHCGRLGELDIIARDGEYLVFVEVKSRRTLAYGAPEQAVSPSKQRRIRRLALSYLHTNRLHGAPCRFDVVAVDYRSGAPLLRHIPNAFC